MAGDVSEWLEGLGLGRYADAFGENEIDLDALPYITEDDLKDIGVALGARRKLLAAIAALEPATAQSSEDGAVGDRASGVEAERRQLTVMFCDLVGSTALAERLDPEDMRQVLRAYREACHAVIDRFEGHIANFIGDGLLVYFGYPQAHEDDAARAVHAALGIVAEIGDLGHQLESLDDIQLGARVGIHTGLVVAGDIGSGEVREQEGIVGETPNIAARLEAVAEPDTVMISEATMRLVEGFFVCNELGPQALKGVSQPVTVYRVQAAADAPGRFEATTTRDLTPLVGRESEIGLLLNRWALAKDGEGQVVLLSGEAGVGKSRILRGFRDRLGSDPHNRILYYGSPYHRNSALYPVVDQFERGLRFERDDDPPQKLDKLETVLTDLDLPVDEHAPVLAQLLSLATDGRYPPVELSPEEFKKRTFDANLAIVEAMAARAPVLVVAEDLHWIDPSTLEFLDLVVERLRRFRVLLLGAARPEFENPWSGHAHVTALTLNRLSRRESATLVGKVTYGKSLPDEVLDEIVAKTDGVPLFVEELTKTVVESGLLHEAGDRFELSGPLPPLAIPSSLQDSLMARLDRLGPIKDVAQLAAALGRSFRHDLLVAVSPLDDAALDEALSQLVAAGLVYRRGMPPDVTYEFKHALVQDAAYQSLLKSARRQHHRRIADTLRERFPETTVAEPEVLAHHFTEAGAIEIAVDYWQEAGKRASQRSANLEAIAHLSNALDLLETLSETTKRDRRELAVYLVLGPALMVARGMSAPEAERAYLRARELCERVGDPSELFTTTWGLWLCYQQAGQLDIAQGFADEVLVLARKQRDPAFLLQAHHATWTTLHRLAEFPSCLEHTEQGIALYNIDAHGSHAFSYGGHDPGVCARVNGATTLWSLGFPDRALDMVQDAIKLAEQLAHPSTLAFANFFKAIIHQYRQESDLARQHAEAAIAIATENDFAQTVAQGTILRGWATAALGRTEDGIANIREGLRSSLSAKTGTGARHPYFLALLAEACSRAGQATQGLNALQEALERIEETGERSWEAEIHRLKGELLASSAEGDRAAAEACFNQAISIAQRQSAKSPELRAAAGLARLWHGQGRMSDAGNLLAPVYDWFTEGFETIDLKEARGLLDELS